MHVHQGSHEHRPRHLTAHIPALTSPRPANHADPNPSLHFAVDCYFPAVGCYFPAAVGFCFLAALALVASPTVRASASACVFVCVVVCMRVLHVQCVHMTTGKLLSLHPLLKLLLLPVFVSCCVYAYHVCTCKDTCKYVQARTYSQQVTHLPTPRSSISCRRSASRSCSFKYSCSARAPCPCCTQAAGNGVVVRLACVCVSMHAHVCVCVCVCCLCI